MRAEARENLAGRDGVGAQPPRRPRLAPKPTLLPQEDAADVPERPRRGCYRPWAELLKRTFGFDVLTWLVDLRTGRVACFGEELPLRLAWGVTDTPEDVRDSGR